MTDTGANTLTAIMPKILARGLGTLRERCIMPRLVNSDYAIDAAKKGTTIDVPVPVLVETQDVDNQAVGTEKTSLTPTYVQIPLDQWKQNKPIGLTDKDLCQIDATETFLPMQLEEAVKALANLVNVHIFSKYAGTNRGVYGFLCNNTNNVDAIGDPFASTGSTFTSGVSGATGAKKILNVQLCPRTDRRGVLSFDAEANALDLSQFSDAEKIMSAAVKMEGEIGRKYGIDWVADDAVPVHTRGTAFDTTRSKLTVGSGAAAQGDTSLMIIDADNDSATVVPGDILTIANTLTADSQTYVVTESEAVILTSTSAGIEVDIQPALKYAAAAGDVVTIANSHTVNLVFHRDAFAFASRPLLANSSQYSLGNQMVSMQDPVTGLILRLEVSRQHKQTVWEFDILYGADLVRPELAMRLAGAP